MAPPTRMAQTEEAQPADLSLLSNQAITQVFAQAGIQVPQGRQLADLQNALTQRGPDGMGNYERFMQLMANVAPDMSERDRDTMWRNILRGMEASSSQDCSRHVRAGNVAGRDRALGLGVIIISTDVRTQRAEYGQTDVLATRQQSFLVASGQGASDQQREDMLRAAAGMGFSAAAIFGAQAAFNEERRSRAEPKDISDELAMAETNLNEFMRELMIRRMTELRQAQNSIQLNGESPQLRQQRDEAAWGLARLMGGTQPKFEEAREAGREEARPGIVNGQQVADAAFATIWMNVEARRALDNHQLDRVVPRHAA